jgi:chemotaxis protein CheC
MEKPLRFEALQLDALKEVGNIGAGNAATALSKMLLTKIDMKVPYVKVLSFDEIAEYVGGGDRLVVSIFLRLEGEVPGNMFFLMDLQSAKNLVRNLLGSNEGEDHFDEMELSALQEIGNILAGSYLSALADFTGLNLQPSVPALAIDMAMAILGYGLIEIGRSGDYALVIDTTFSNGDEKVEGHFFLIPDPPSFNTLFGALGVPV